MAESIIRSSPILTCFFSSTKIVRDSGHLFGILVVVHTTILLSASHNRSGALSSCKRKCSVVVAGGKESLSLLECSRSGKQDREDVA